MVQGFTRTSIFLNPVVWLDVTMATWDIVFNPIAQGDVFVDTLQPQGEPASVGTSASVHYGSQPRSTRKHSFRVKKPELKSVGHRQAASFIAYVKKPRHASELVIKRRLIPSQLIN